MNTENSNEKKIKIKKLFNQILIVRIIRYYY